MTRSQFKAKGGKALKKIKYLLVLSVAVFVIFPLNAALAENFVYIRQIGHPLNENYVVASPNGEVTFSVGAGSINQPAIYKLMHLADRQEINQFFTYPETITPASDLYFFSFINKADEPATNYSAPPTITVKYQPDDKYKEIYYYDWVNLKFSKINTIRDTINHTLTFIIAEQESITFALFNEQEVTGLASWYVNSKYRNELMAASVDFAQDAKLKVINLDNNKEVVVTVKDYGPKKCADWTEKEQKQMGPCQDRLLDLSSIAFKKLAPTSQGIINIAVRPVE